MGHRIDVLGPPRVLDSATARVVELPLGKPLALLSYLAVERRAVSRVDLGRLLWPDSDESRARHSVRQAIWLLRKTLGEGVLEGDDPVSVSAELASDLREFDGALRSGEMEVARSLWRGPLLARLHLPECKEWELWLEERQELLAGRYFQALLDTGRLHGEAGSIDQAIPFLEEALALNPYSLVARELHFECLLELKRWGPARDALAEAKRAIEDQEGGLQALARMEERLTHLQSRVRAAEPERLGEALEFVGRSAEMADLSAFWRRSQGSRLGLVSLAGPTGIGKTRLAREFLAQLERGGARVAQARGYRGEEGIAWGTVADLIRELMALPGSAGVSSASDALLRSVLPSLVPNGGFGAALTPPNPAALSDAVTDLVEAVAFEVSLAVFVDDFQWVDPESRALLASVIRRIRTTPVFFLLAERTGDGPHPRHSLTEGLIGEVGGRRIRPRALSAEEVREALGLLCEFSAPEDAGDLSGEMHRVSGGNPLFLGELLRKLAAEGVCRFEAGRWILDCERFPEVLALPASMRALIEERLDRLAPVGIQVITAVARERRSASARSLRIASGLEEGIFDRAVEELVAQEVLVWSTSDDLDFAHDQLREAAAVRFGSPAAPEKGGGWSKNPLRLLLVASVLILAVLGGWKVARRLPLTVGSSQPTYPYGKGRIAVVGDSLFAIVPPDREGGEWKRDTSAMGVAPRHAGVMVGPFHTPDGEYRWFGYVREGEEPPFAAEFLPDGSVRVLHNPPGDAGVQGLSPDGRSILIGSQDSLSESYSIELLVMDVATGEKRTLYRAPEMIPRARWSPDGNRIAALIRHRVDTLLVLTPEGRVLQRYAFPEYEAVGELAWCEDNRHVVLGVADFGRQGGLLLDLDGLEPPTPFGWEAQAGISMVCLGAARGALFLGLTEGGWLPHMLDFETGELLRLPDGLLFPGIHRVQWVPDEPAATARFARIAGGNVRLPFAERRQLAFEISRGDGPWEEVSARWRSSDPSVASVSEGGWVTANRAGEAVLVGEYASWLRDSIRVQVVDEGPQPEEVMFRDTFPDLGNWVLSADPPPQITGLNGERVLELRGDGRYRDFMRTRERFSLDRGATLELEFQLPLTRRDRQRILVCLAGGQDPLDLELSWNTPSVFCFRYPYDENVKFRDDLAQVSVGTASVPPPDVSRWIPRDGWVHLALQVRPDGTGSLFLDRELVKSYEFHLEMDPTLRWHIELDGFAQDTHLYVRNLVLWRGERF